MIREASLAKIWGRSNTATRRCPWVIPEALGEEGSDEDIGIMTSLRLFVRDAIVIFIVYENHSE